MQKSLDRFFEYLTHEKRFSPHTLTSYSTDLNQLLQFCSEGSYSFTQWAEIDHFILRSWIISFIDEGLDAKTINRKISSLKSFYKFLLRQGEITKDPTLKLSRPKMSKKLPVFIEEKQIGEVLDNFFDESFEGQRNRLILELFYSTGIRLSELINLKRDEVDIYNNQIKVTGKGNKERVVPFTLNLRKRIVNYIELLNAVETTSSEKTLFIKEDGKKLYPKLVYNLVRSHLEHITNLERKSPHILRHSFATHMLNSGADINAIKELLGHSSLAATQVYTHNDLEKLKRVYKQAHPKA